MEILKRINYHPNFAGDKMTSYWSPYSRVGTVIAIVAHHEIFIFTKSSFGIGGRGGVYIWFCQKSAVGEFFVVDKHLTVADFYCFTGGSDNPFDKGNINILWPFENYDITSLGCTEAIGNLINNNVLVVMESWFH